MEFNPGFPTTMIVRHIYICVCVSSIEVRFSNQGDGSEPPALLSSVAALQKIPVSQPIRPKVAN